MVSKKRAILVLGLVGMSAVVATAAALSTVEDSPTEGFTPIQYAQETGDNASAARIDGRTLAEALQQLRARVGGRSISEAEVRAVPATASAAGGNVVFVTVSADAPGPAAIKATWEAELLVGALRDIAAERQLGTLDNFLISTRFPDGRVVPNDSGFGNVTKSQLFDRSKDGEIKRRIRAGLESAGLKPRRITFIQALQSSPVVIASADDPASAVAMSTDASFWTKMLGDYDNYEGYYLELRDQNGDPFLVSTAAHRAGSSSGWIRTDLRPTRIATHPVPTGGDGG